jgi:hypothetical protein
MKNDIKHDQLSRMPMEANGHAIAPVDSNDFSLIPPQIQLKAENGQNSGMDLQENKDKAFQLSQNPDSRTSSLPNNIKSNAESISGFSLDDVKVHYNSEKPAQLNAYAYAQGNDIHIEKGQEKHVAHEAWHVVQQKQGIVNQTSQMKDKQKINSDSSLEQEADIMASAISAGSPSDSKPDGKPIQKSMSPNSPIQRQVRVSGGSKKIKEKEYLPGGAKESVGSKFNVGNLISDPIKRAFTNETELENYANGSTDYIGDVKTASAGTYWYRLPKNKLTVLGEYHHNADGNVPDVINGFGTSRFKYEPFNEVQNIGAINNPHDSTNARIDEIDKKSEVAGNVDKVKFNPGMENIVLKAMTGCGILRNQFIAGSPKTMAPPDVTKWSGRPTTADYSIGERTALYFTMAIHIAKDISKENYGTPTMMERSVVTAARNLQTYYRQFQFFFDFVKNWKDGDELVGIYELTKILNFLLLPIFEKFAELFHIYGSHYIQELGAETGNKALTKEGAKLEANPGAGAKTSDFSPAREEIIWNKVLEAKSGGYLLAGMGDAHRRNLKKRLAKEGIPQEEVTDSLERQKNKIKRKWKK